MIRMIVCLLGLLICPLLNASLLESVEVEHVSSSGRSFVLSRGHLEGFRVGMKAQFLQVEGPKDLPQVKSIGYGDLVKITPKQSFWILKEIDHAHRTKAGDKIRLIRQDLALQGVDQRFVRQKKIVLAKGERHRDVLQERREGMPDELIEVEQEKFGRIDLPLEDNQRRSADLETTEYTSWLKRERPEFVEEAMQELEVRYISSENEVMPAEDYRQEDRREIFRSYVNSFIDRINRQPKGLHSLYEKNLDASYREEVAYIVEKKNLYYQTINPESEAISVVPHSKQKMRRDGELWSADLNDEELRSFMLTSGLAQERRRQELALTEDESHEVIFRANTGLVNNTNPDDPNFQNISYGLSASYEYALKRIAPFLGSFTLDLEIFSNLNFYEMGEGLNGRFQDGGFGGALNYYFYNGPFTVDRLALFGGVGIKRSTASGSSEVLTGQTTYTYQVLTLPSFHVGAKYRFPITQSYRKELRIGYGVNALLSVERKSLSVQEEVIDPIYSSFSVNDTRLSVGMSFYF